MTLSEPSATAAASAAAAAAAAPRRLNAVTPFLSVLDRQFLAPALLSLGTGRLRLLAVGLLLLLAVQVLRWWRRTWSFDGRVLQVASGVVARNTKVVPADRIQQVTVVQRLRHRLFGVASLRVEVAGGGGSGVELDALPVSQAAALRSALLAAKERSRAVPVPADTDADADADDTGATQVPWVPAPWLVVDLSYRQLAVAGLTGGQLLVIFAAAGSLLQFADDLPGSPLRRLGDVDVGVLGPLAWAAAALVFIVVWLGSAAGAAILRDAGFRLTLVGDDLHLERGLLDRKEAVLPLARVQAVRVTASPLRRWLGYVTVRLQSAAPSGGTDEEQRRVVVPLLAKADVGRVLALVLPGADIATAFSGDAAALQAPPSAARRRAVVRWTVPTVVAAIVLAVALRPWGALGLVLLPAVGVALGLAAYRGLGHALVGEVLIARTGAVVRRTVVVPVVRAQSARTRSSPFQRRAGLTTMVVDLAGSGANPRVVDEATSTAHDLRRAVVARIGDR